MLKFKVFTDRGSWLIEAESVNDAFRKALWFCWRDGEDFHHMESADWKPSITLKLWFSFIVQL